MRIAIMGAQGRLGYHLTYALQEEHEVFPLSRFNADISNLENLQNLLAQISPDIIINATDFYSEKDEEAMFMNNAGGAVNLAVAALAEDAHLLHFSCAQVLAASADKTVKAKLAPDTAYAQSKAEAEMHLQKIFKAENFAKYTIVRLGTLCGGEGDSLLKNFEKLLKKQKKIEAVSDFYFSLSDLNDVATEVKEILTNLKKQQQKILHIYSEKKTSPYLLVKKIAKEMGKEVEVSEIKGKERDYTIE